MKIKSIALITILISILSTKAFAGGSFRFDTELEPLLNQKPELKKFILETFDIAESGYAPNRIGSQVNKKFGGRRLGPYILKAKPKGQEGDDVFELVFHAEHIFLDKNGSGTELSNADVIQEEFKSIEIKLIEKEPK